MMGSRWLGLGLGTDTMHNNPKVHSGMHEYNFRGIGHFSILLDAISKSE